MLSSDLMAAPAIEEEIVQAEIEDIYDKEDSGIDRGYAVVDKDRLILPGWIDIGKRVEEIGVVQ